MWRRVLIVLALGTLAPSPSRPQSLAPRAYWPAPRHFNVLSVGYGYQKGDILTDPSLPIQDTQSKTHALTGGYPHFFDLAGRTASVSVEVPWASTSLDALIEEDSSGRDLWHNVPPFLRGFPGIVRPKVPAKGRS